jgi:hypothetical protein
MKGLFEVITDTIAEVVVAPITIPRKIFKRTDEEFGKLCGEDDG